MTGGVAPGFVGREPHGAHDAGIERAMRIVAAECARMWALIQPYRSIMDYGRTVVTRMHGEHAEIVDALARRDRDRYCRAVEAHQRHIYAVIDQLAAAEESGADA